MKLSMTSIIFTLLFSFYGFASDGTDQSEAKSLRWLIPGGKVTVQKFISAPPYNGMGIQDGEFFKNIQEMSFAKPQCVVLPPRSGDASLSLDLPVGMELTLSEHHLFALFNERGISYNHYFEFQTNEESKVVFQCFMGRTAREMDEADLGATTRGILSWQSEFQAPQQGSGGSNLMDYATSKEIIVGEDLKTVFKFYQGGQDGAVEFDPKREFCSVDSYNGIEVKEGDRLTIKETYFTYSTEAVFPGMKPHSGVSFIVAKASQPKDHINIACYSPNMATPTDRDFNKALNGKFKLSKLPGAKRSRAK